LQSDADIGEDRMNAILRSHRIDPHMLRDDAFDSFFRQREMELLQLIEVAMDKPIARDSVELTAPEPTDYEGEAQTLSEYMDDEVA
jgi:hypothetical protein